jgi:hypothetical protein
MATKIHAHIYARGEVSFAKFLFLPSWFAKLLETNFGKTRKVLRPRSPDTAGGGAMLRLVVSCQEAGPQVTA